MKRPDPPLLFWMTLDVLLPRPVRKGMLLLSKSPLFPLVDGTPLLIAKFAPLGFAKGT